MKAMHAVTIALTSEGGEPIENTSFVPTNLRAVEGVEQDFVVKVFGVTRRFTVSVRFEPGLLLREGD